MGTVASIHVFDDAPVRLVDAAIGEVLAELDRLEAIFSVFRADSEVSRINRGTLAVRDACPEVIDVLDACTWLEHASQGAFDIHRVPGGPIDPSGFVKGWATERAASALDRAGLRRWYVSVGGDMVLRGRPEPDRRWQVAIPHPARPELVARLEVDEGAVATSGTAARGLHLWDPRTGQDATELASLTVIGPSLTWADAFATAAFVLGENGPAWVEQFDGYTAFGVRPDGGIVGRAVALDLLGARRLGYDPDPLPRG